MTERITARQADVLRYIAQHIVKWQRPPTRKEISAHFGWSSSNAAETHIQTLERDGYVALDGAAGSQQWQRYVRVLRWPQEVLPIINLTASV